MKSTKKRSVTLYDVTLRDGTQAEDVNFSADDKLRVMHLLDEFGFHYIEGGYPGSNPKDKEFFERARKDPPKNAKLTAFGMTARAGNSPGRDSMIKTLLGAETPVVCIVGKTWDFHVKRALEISNKQNLDLIRKTMAYLKTRRDEVIFDAEHFFDGYYANPEYAVECLRAAHEGGADLLVLCDTNGGRLPHEIAEVVKAVPRAIPGAAVGVHLHNDSDTAVASSLAAVQAGAVQVQGTVNGYGERCGNANLISITAGLQLKLGHKLIPAAKMKQLTELSRTVDELANLGHNQRAAYVGKSAFAHKGGMHVSAVIKNPLTYEHVTPESVGNTRRVLMSDLAGRSNVMAKGPAMGQGAHDKVSSKKVLEVLKERESQGYQFEGADGSYELLVQKALGKHKVYFKLIAWRVINEKREGDDAPLSEATITLEVDGVREHTASMGNGPVNALDKAMRKALEKFYPELAEVELIDFKVRVVSAGAGTDAKVRVLITSSDHESEWATVGVSDNVIDASWLALTDGIDYKLLKGEMQSKKRVVKQTSVGKAKSREGKPTARKKTGRR